MRRLTIFMGVRRLGTLDLGSDGSLTLTYDEAWLEGADAFPLSLSLPLRQRKVLRTAGPLQGQLK